MSSQRTKSRRWRPWQFSLRTLITLMLVFGAGFGWLAMRLEQTRRQREAVGQLVARGLTVSYDYQLRGGKPPAGAAAPPRTYWRKKLGDDFFDRVVAVDQASGRISDEHMHHFDALRHVERVDLSGARITDRGIVHLRNLTRLKSLNLWGCGISDEGVRSLHRLKNLERLVLGTARLQGPGLIHLQEMRNLKALYLSHTNVDDESLTHLSPLKNLRQLTLFDTPITDASVKTLAGFTTLKYLLVGGTQISGEGLDELCRALPKCNVVPKQR